MKSLLNYANDFNGIVQEVPLYNYMQEKIVRRKTKISLWGVGYWLYGKLTIWAVRYSSMPSTSFLLKSDMPHVWFYITAEDDVSMNI